MYNSRNFHVKNLWQGWKLLNFSEFLFRINFTDNLIFEKKKQMKIDKEAIIGLQSCKTTADYYCNPLSTWYAFLINCASFSLAALSAIRHGTYSVIYAMWKVLLKLYCYICISIIFCPSNFFFLICWNEKDFLTISFLKVTFQILNLFPISYCKLRPPTPLQLRFPISL